MIELGPLSQEDAEILVGGELDAASAKALYEESGGNPFYLLALSRAAHSRDRPDPSLGGPADQDVPATVLSTIADELSGLSPSARVALQAGAVVGDPFEADLAAEVAKLDEESMLECIDDLLEAELIVPGQSPRDFRFRHPIVRHAVYTFAGRGGGWRLTAGPRRRWPAAGRRP